VRSELIAYVDDQGQRIRNRVRQNMRNDRDRLRAAAASLPRPLDLLAVARQRLDHAASNLLTALRHAGQRKTIDLGRVAPLLTPQLLGRRARELRTRLIEAGRRNDAAAARTLERRTAAFATISARLSPSALKGDLRHSRNRMVPIAARLTPAFERLLQQRRARLDSAAKLLESYSYKNVLDRGFALVTDAEGRIVRSKDAVGPGNLLSIEVSNGQIGATVTGAPMIRRRPRPPKDSPEQESLF
jgi:exodeoxyribonuclease VII large subunit